MRITLLFATYTVGLILAASPARAQDMTLALPLVHSSFNIDSLPVAVTSSGVLSRVSHGGGQDVFRLEMTTDLADLQHNATALLRAQLDRDDRCGDRISIQDATLLPAAPASLLTTRLHYERWACAKAFGKQIVKRLAGGDAVVKVKIVPSVEGGSAVKLEAEVANIEADGSLGEMLRSGSLGETLRQKIRTSLESALEKGAANLNATLPPAMQSFASIHRVGFADAGGGRLAVTLAGEIRVPAGKVGLMLGELKPRAAAR